MLKYNKHILFISLLFCNITIASELTVVVHTSTNSSILASYFSVSVKDPDPIIVKHHNNGDSSDDKKEYQEYLVIDMIIDNEPNVFTNTNTNILVESNFLNSQALTFDIKKSITASGTVYNLYGNFSYGASINIYNLYSQKTRTLPVDRSTTVMPIDMSMFPVGIYFIEVISNDNREVFKIIR